MIFAIEREWGKEPGWLASLPVERAESLIGEWKARHEKATPKGKKR